MALHLFVHFDQKQQSRIKAQIPAIWGTGSFIPTPVATNHVQAAAGTHVQLTAKKVRAGKWIPATVQRVQVDQN